MFEAFEIDSEAQRHSQVSTNVFDDIEENMLAIAKQTGKLVIYQKDQNQTMKPGYFEDAIMLTLAEDIVIGEEFYFKNDEGKLIKIISENEITSIINTLEPLIIEFTKNNASNSISVGVSAEEVYEALLTGRRVIYIIHSDIDNYNHSIISGNFSLEKANNSQVKIYVTDEQIGFANSMYHIGFSVGFED